MTQSEADHKGGNTVTSGRASSKLLRLHPSDILVYHFCDRLSELLIYFIVVFSPWAFGTTETWSVWTMNISGYILGLLLLLKLLIRNLKPYRADFWTSGLCQPKPAGRSNTHQQFCTHATNGLEAATIQSIGLRLAGSIITTLAVLTFVILFYIFLSALNSCAIYRSET